MGGKWEKWLGVVLGALLQLPCVPAEATEWLKVYASGPELCQKYADFTDNETGDFVEVPIDYSRLQLGTTPVYYWSLKPLEPAKPTLVYLAGGPGISSHDGELRGLDEWFNIVYVDQRGIGCSKPRTFALSRDPSFYSSENTARDVETIRKRLQLEQITVYGHSYGTVPATIYASLYPESTRALVLEGTIFKGDDSLYQSDRRRRLMQENFDALPKPLRDRVLAVSRLPGVAPDWYSRVNFFMMYLDDSFRLLRGWLEGTLRGSDQALEGALAGFAPQPLVEDEFGFNLVMHAMISCRELGMGSPGASFYSVFDAQARLVSNGIPEPRTELCRELAAGPAQGYDATRYPVTAPITYFQGEFDVATELPGAERHFRSVPRGPAQFLVLEKGGHVPNRFALQDLHDSDPAVATQREAFVEAALGRPIGEELLARLNGSRALKWSLSRR